MRKGNKGFVKRITAWMLTLVMVLSLVMVPAGKVEAAESVIATLTVDTSTKTETASETGNVDVSFTPPEAYDSITELSTAGVTKLQVTFKVSSCEANGYAGGQAYFGYGSSWKNDNSWANIVQGSEVTSTLDISSYLSGGESVYAYGILFSNLVANSSITYQIVSVKLVGSGSSSGSDTPTVSENEENVDGTSMTLVASSTSNSWYDEWLFTFTNNTGSDVNGLEIIIKTSKEVSPSAQSGITASYDSSVGGIRIYYSGTVKNGETLAVDDSRKVGYGKSGNETVQTGYYVSAINCKGTVVTDNDLDLVIDYNYAKLLQYSLYFYDANMCGTDVGSDSVLSWRDNCHTGDASVSKTINGTPYTIDVSGGYHDAGDHAKFGLPQAYSASVLGLSYAYFKDAYVALGQDAHLKNILDRFTTYFENCTIMDASGNVIAFCYQVGDGNDDHGYWGPAEEQESVKGERDVYVHLTDSSNPCTDIVAETAAALAIYATIYKEEDSTNANTALEYAKKLLAYAESNNKVTSSTSQAAGFYNGSSYNDDLALASIWIHKAIGDTDTTYQNKYNSYIQGCTDGHLLCWDDVSAAAYFSGGATYNSKVASIMTKKMATQVTPQNFTCVDGSWGSARYNTALQFTGLVYDEINNTSAYQSWATSQMKYLLGDNDTKQCYVIGYNKNDPKHPHHRSASGYDNVDSHKNDPMEHTLYGALVGGPNASDYYNDCANDYQYSEVAIDYNAAFVGAAAALYLLNKDDGQQELVTSGLSEVETYYLPTVTNPVAVTGVSLDKTTLALKAGETSTLTATITPSDATTQGVTWSSSDSSVVSVSGSGKTATVKGLKSGNTTITVTTKDGSYTATCTVTVTNPLTAFTLNQTNVSLTKGSTTKVSIASTTPTSPDAYTTSWSSNATSIATVDQSGNVTAVGKGSATITVTANGISKTCTVTVTVPLEAIDLDKSTISLTKGQTTTITASPSPNDADLGTVTWTSSDSSVASLTSTGKTVTVTAKKSGTATITAKTGSIEKTCNVTVTTPVTGITLDSATTPLQLEVDETANALSYTITPSDADNKSVTWSVTGSAVTVDSNGKITAKEKGTATVTVKTVDGNFTATRQINVVGKSVKGISLDKSTLSLKVKDTDTLVATITPSDADDKTVTWESSSPSVATVSNGTVTAVGEGTTTITAKASSFIAQCTVTVAKREQATPTVTYSAATRSKDSVTVTGALSSSASDTTGVLEYSVDGVNWKTAESNGTVTFSGLNEFTKYTVRSRLKGDTTYKASAVSANTIDIYTLVANPLTIDVSKLSDENYVDALCTQDNSHTITYSNGVLDLKHSTSTYANGYTIVGENSNVKITTSSNKITLNNATIGSLDVSKLNGQTVALTISGDVNIINGITSAYDVDLTIAGTGTLTTNGIQTKGDVTISSGTINVDASGTSNVAISAENITITGGSVTATGGTGQAAITAKNNITIQDSDTTDGVKPNVTANGGAGASAIVAGTEASAEGEGTILLENASIKVDSGDPIEENGTRQSAIATSGEYGKIVIEGDTSISSEKSNDNLYSVDPVDANGNAIIQYSITLTYEDGSTVIVQVKKDSSYTLPAIPSTKGYEKAWVTSDTEYEQGSIFVVTGDVTFMVQASVIYVSGITLNATEKTIEAGDTFTLTANVKPADALDTSVTWSSDNVAVATVDQNGKVTAVAAGTATVTATAKDGSGKSASCAITVEKKITPSDNPTLTPDYTNPPASSDIVAIQGIKITGPTKKVAPGKKVALKVEFTPENSSNQSVVWKVDKPKYATVNNNGVVTTKKAGKGKKVTVTAYSAEDNSIKATYKITIMKDVVKKIKLSAKTTTLKKGKSVTIEAKLTPVKGISKELTWTSSNPKIATVNAKGKVTAKKAGTVKITAKAKDGSGKKATINIKVK